MPGKTRAIIRTMNQAKWEELSAGLWPMSIFGL